MGGIQMDEKLKKALRDAFEPPAPKQKEAFLKRIPQPGISNLSFVLSQAGYIRKYVWGISAVLFGTAFMGAHMFGKDVMWGISALLPFAAVLADNGKGFVQPVLFQPGKDGHIASLEKAACGRQLGHHELILVQHLRNPVTIVRTYNRINNLHSFHLTLYL